MVIWMQDRLISFFNHCLKRYLNFQQLMIAKPLQRKQWRLILTSLSAVVKFSNFDNFSFFRLTCMKTVTLSLNGSQSIPVHLHSVIACLQDAMRPTQVCNPASHSQPLTLSSFA